MGKLFQFGNVIVRVYANDHLPPHFHVITPDAEAMIEIATLAFLAGSMKPAVGKTVMAWARENRSIVIGEWNRINPRFPISEGEGP